MSNFKPDRRIAKTRKSLGAALFELLQNNSWNGISIQQICDTANVSRASFYAHFDTKVALLDSIIEQQLFVVSQPNLSPTDGRTYLIFLTWLIDHITSNKRLFSRIAQDPEAQPVLSRFKTALTKELVTALKKDNLFTNNTAVAFILGGTFDALIMWSRDWKIKQLPQLKIDILAYASRVIGNT